MDEISDLAPGAFRVIGADPNVLRRNPYRAALDFIRGRYWVEGDLLAAVRAIAVPQGTAAFRSWLEGLFVWLGESRPATWFRRQKDTAGDIRFHYDRSNEFYKQFLDSRMVYSCGYFGNASCSLEEAQFAKLERICCKLDLRCGETLLDIGCGWGALLFHAADRFDVKATGCTLSEEQWHYVSKVVRERDMGKLVSIQELDFHDVRGSFDKLASIGMFEHVGRAGLPGYFAKAHGLLKRDGLFLNHGIVRRSGCSFDSESLFVRREVFPGTALVTLPVVLQQAELEGFEVLDVENLRPHYVLTCRAWIDRLQSHGDACRKLVDEETYRTWLLYLAGSAVNFESGDLDVHQILMARRDSRARPLTRNYC